MDTLYWSHQKGELTSCANKALDPLKLNQSCAPTATISLAYKARVLSKIECASLIWNPHQMCLKQETASIQNQAARFTCHDYKSLAGITALKNNLGHRSLA